MIRLLLITLLTLTSCTNLWIPPGQSPWSTGCGLIDAFNNPQYREIWGNGIDDTCDGLIDPGNGSMYVELHNDDTTSTHLEFYNGNSADEPAFSTFLHPNHSWEITFLFIASFTPINDVSTWTYLYGNDSSTLGFRDNNGYLEVLYEFRTAEETHRLVQQTNTKLEINTVVTIEYFAADSNDCNFNNTALYVALGNEYYNSGSLSIEGSAEYDCDFADTSPVTFASRSTLPADFTALNGAVDDIIIAERIIEQTDRQPLIEQIQEYSDSNMDALREAFQDITWFNIDLWNGHCSVGYMDYLSNIGAAYVSTAADCDNDHTENTISVYHIDDYQ